MLPPGLAWQRLLLLREVVTEQPELARAFQRLPLYDQLALTVDLLRDSDAPPEPMPSNVILFRPSARR